MPEGKSNSALRQIRDLFASGTTAGLTDAQLLRRYADRRDEAAGAAAVAESAFAALVDRHGPMVWGVCRRALGDVHEAEDAFQATFLVLARRAGAVRVDGSLGRWLHGVARRVAARARADCLRRKAGEMPAEPGEASRAARDAETLELLAALGEEVGRLPERYRSPLVLCHLEGLTYAGAAERLGWPAATVKGRLARARALLRSRLIRRGLGPPAAVIGASAATEVRAAVPAALVERAVRAASTLARSADAAGVSTPALILAKGVIRTMLVIRLSKVATLIALASAGTWLLAGPAPSPEAAAQAPAPSEPKTQPPVAPADGPDAPSSAITVPMPEPVTLHKLLRRAAEEAITLVQIRPDPTSSTLSTIAMAQAVSADPSGARQTFHAAVREAGGEFGSLPFAMSLWRVAHAQAEVGFNDDARWTLQRALDAVPGVTADHDKDVWSVWTLSGVVRDQVRIGDRDDARRTADRLQAFIREMIGKAGNSSAQGVASDVAAALAAAGDFDAAFERAGADRNTASVLGQVALSAAEHLDGAVARRFVDEVAARLDLIGPAELKYAGLYDLAKAQARIGEVAAAKRTARSVGVGATDPIADPSAGPPYAMIRIAAVQRESGDTSGARATLREVYQIIRDHPNTRIPEGGLTSIAAAQVAAGDIEGALTTALAMPKGRRYQTLALIARARIVAGDREAARATVALVLEDAPDADEVRKHPSISAEAEFAEIQAMAGDVAGALKTLGTIRVEHGRPPALEGVVNARALAGDVAGALRLALEESRSPEERRRGLQGLGQGVAERIRQGSPPRPAK